MPITPENLMHTSDVDAILARLSPEQPVLIAGPTASGKSALALAIAQAQGGVIVNADASQVYECWRLITARPSVAEEQQAPHALYGHLAATTPYSAGHWLRDVAPYLNSPIRPIIVGGTGLYFTALTNGLADIPATPDKTRIYADGLTLPDLLIDIDRKTRNRIDTLNRARVQRAWEVQRTTGRGLADWQDNTPAPLLPLSKAFGIVFDVEKPWLDERIARRFGLMLEQGALDEISAVRPHYDPALPAHRAIGVPELMAYAAGQTDLSTATQRAAIASRQYAKRQRTWMRSKMRDWHRFTPT